MFAISPFAVRPSVIPLLPLAALTLLSACSHHPNRQMPLSEALITNITADGLRQFTYEVAVGGGDRQGRGAPGGGLGGGAPRSGPPGGSGPGSMEGNSPRGGNGMGTGRKDPGANIGERLAARLEETGYCVNGWFVIRIEETDGKKTLFGECKAVLPQAPQM